MYALPYITIKIKVYLIQQKQSLVTAFDPAHTRTPCRFRRWHWLLTEEVHSAVLEGPSLFLRPSILEGVGRRIGNTSVSNDGGVYKGNISIVNDLGGRKIVHGLRITYM